MSTQKQESAVIEISGMSCNHCAQHIQKALKQTSGVNMARVVHTEEKAYIDYDPTMINAEALLQIINDFGFEGVLSG